jgi:TetR/AcrR family transcriptional repressor of nem operon
MTTQQKLIDSARYFIQTRGYNGFSYADVAAQVNVRKASIHHHFPSKADLARAVVDESRMQIEQHARALADAGVHPRQQLQTYTGYWEKCITDASAPFCVAGMLAAELPTLPGDLADAVRSHFRALAMWLETVLDTGVQLGAFTLRHSVRREAEAFMATVYGAMLIARAYATPTTFAEIVDVEFKRLLASNGGLD